MLKIRSLMKPLALLILSINALGFDSYVIASDVITVSYPGPSLFYVPQQIANQQGFFKNKNLDVKMVITKTDVDRAALISGNIDFSLRGSGTLLSALKGLPVQLIFVGTTKPFWVLVVRPELASVKDLKGKTMAIAGLAGSHHLATRAILRENGVDPDREIVFKVVGAGARIPALASHSIDGVLMTYDEGYKAKKHGYKILANAADYPSLLILSSAIGVNPDFARKNPELVKRFLSANVQALSFMRENPEATLRVIMTWLKLDLETAEAVQQLAVGNFTKDGTIDDSVLKEIVQQQMSEANIKDPVALSKVADFSLLRQVLKETRLP